ncbi:uncharacterized protein TA18190 [Theileria annulata]|uniref:Apicomplexan specific coiled coil protein n=1 Tax=Theileria annulata TaxID=5874 RepID=Q4UB14_THEAN|nr:uncharacterized protein TA18190 [Theileria annulata]CAI75987.1 hypothetical protein, conserved [Theileria annulata]|eukprot:XP_955463.1 hypothetical protein, conserved [Theileria annulata]
METEVVTSNLTDLESFILTKYDPLLTIVKELNDGIQNLEKEKLRLERRIYNLEQYLLSKDNSNSKDSLNEDFNVPLDLSVVEDESYLSLPWLFSCQTGTPLSTLQVLLEFHPDNTIELDVSSWLKEENMWISLLEDLLLNLSMEYSKDEFNELQTLRKLARRSLKELAKNEMLIVLRNVPGKEEASSNTTCITLVAILASTMSDAWKVFHTHFHLCKNIDCFDESPIKVEPNTKVINLLFELHIVNRSES